MIIDIIILSYNRLAYLKKNIQNLNARTKYPHRIIVVDNKSSDEKIKKLLSDYKKSGKVDKIILNPKNYLLQGWYYGLKEVRSDYFVITDPDIIVPDVKPCWLERLVDILDKNDEIVRAGISLDSGNIPPCWNKKQGKRLAFRTGPWFDKESSLKKAYLDTTIQLIRKNSFEAAGGFNRIELNIDFWKKLSYYGMTVSLQNITAYHLGWNEYVDYPEYLLEKSKNIRYYPEINLIDALS